LALVPVMTCQMVRIEDEDGTMAVDEAARHQLYNSWVDVLGDQSTGTIMELLRPVGWADVATKQDLNSLENAVRTELHSEIGSLRTEFHATMRMMLFSMIGAMFSLAGLTWAAVTFSG